MYAELIRQAVEIVKANDVLAVWILDNRPHIIDGKLSERQIRFFLCNHRHRFSSPELVEYFNRADHKDILVLLRDVERVVSRTVCAVA